MIAEPVELIATASEPVTSVSPDAPVSKDVAKDLVSGTSALAAGVVIERGLGFFANLLAARVGGTTTFGAYSLAITTANNISTYAAGGIGATAVRFSGQYDRRDPGYANLTRALLIISFASAALAAAVLWAGSSPLARLVGQGRLTALLQWTALSAAGMILLECCRGFLVGQRRIPAILLLSLSVGIGMIVTIPVTARWGAIPMICSQGSVTLAAVLLCLALYRPLGLAAVKTATDAPQQPLRPMLWTVWSFGLVQLAGLIGLNAAGWWLTSLIARTDKTMTEMGFFAIANQLRNLVSLAPNLVTESSLAVMARPSSVSEPTTPDSVMAACTFAVGSVSLLLAGFGMIVVPGILPLLYGKAYASASAATSLALATAIVHMGTGPAAARLSIVSIRLTGVINTVWAIVVGGAASTFLLWNGSAAKGMSIYFAAHALSALLVFRALAKRGHLAQGLGAFYAVGGVSVTALLALSVFRTYHPESSIFSSLVMSGVLLLSLFTWFALGNSRPWAPSAKQILLTLARVRFRRDKFLGVHGGSRA